MVLLPLKLKLVLVRLLSIKIDHSVRDIHVEFVRVAEEGRHDGLVPGGAAGGYVVEGLDLVHHFGLGYFQHFGHFGDCYLGVVLEDAV